MNDPRQQLSLDIPAQGSIVLRALGMGHTDKVLFNDRAFIQNGCHIMRRCPNQLDPTLMRLAVRVGSLERWEKGMMDIDDPAGHGRAERIRQDLNIARERTTSSAPDSSTTVIRRASASVLLAAVTLMWWNGRSWFTTTFW